MASLCKGIRANVTDFYPNFQGWDRCWRKTSHPSGYCYQHRNQAPEGISDEGTADES